MVSMLLIGIDELQKWLQEKWVAWAQFGPDYLELARLRLEVIRAQIVLMWWTFLVWLFS